MNDSKTIFTPPPSATTMLSDAGTTPYLPPCIAVMEIQVEQGYAASVPGYDNDSGL